MSQSLNLEPRDVYPYDPGCPALAPHKQMCAFLNAAGASLPASMGPLARYIAILFEMWKLLLHFTLPVATDKPLVFVLCSIRAWRAGGAPHHERRLMAAQVLRDLHGRQR